MRGKLSKDSRRELRRKKSLTPTRFLSIILAVTLVTSLVLMPMLAFASEQSGGGAASEPTGPAGDAASEVVPTDTPTGDTSTEESGTGVEPGETQPAGSEAEATSDANTSGTSGAVAPASEVLDLLAVNYTVTFKYEDGTAHATHTVENARIQLDANGNYYCTQPTNPALPAGKVSFKGWFLQATDGTLDAQPFDFSTPLTGDITLVAQFNEKYLVQFYYAYEIPGTVAFSREVLAVEAIAEPSTTEMVKVNRPTESLYVDYWYYLEEGEEVILDFTTPQYTDKDLKVYPSFKNKHYVLFVSAGSQINPPVIVVSNDGTITAPTDPSREGYEFSHWSLTEGGAPFSFGTKITQNTTLYAVWTAKTVNYTVAIWMEKPGYAANYTPTHANGDKSQYNYVTSFTMQGTAGTNTIVSTTTAPGIFGNNGLLKTDDLLRYGTYQDIEQKVILGNGLTVVNLYVKRTIYTYTFNLGSHTLSSTDYMTIEGVTYSSGNTQPRYSLQVKYEMDISALFPVQGVDFAEFEGHASGFLSWTRPSTMTWKDAADIASRRNTVDSSMLSQNGQTLAYMFTANWTAGNGSYAYRYFAEVLPGQTATSSNSIVRSGVTYLLMDEYSQTFSATNLGQKAINGLYKVGNTSYRYNYTNGSWIASNNGSIRCFFYTRVSYQLSFNMMAPAGSVTNVPTPNPQTLMFEQTLVDKRPTTDPSRDGYTFLGWYKDADYKVEFDFAGTKMPNGPMTIYAKWESNDHIVQYFNALTDTAEHSHEGVADGGYAIHAPYQPGANVEGRGIFEYWYYLYGGLPVVFDLTGVQVWQDYTIYAHFRTDNLTLTYNAGAGSGVPPVDDDTYALNANTRVKDGGGLNGPSGQIFYAWKDQDGDLYYPGSLLTFTSGNVVLTAQFADPGDLVTLTYHSNYPTGTNTSVSGYVLRGTSPALFDQRNFACEGYEFAGWSTAADGQATYQPGDAFGPLNDDDDVYAVWRMLITITADDATRGYNGNPLTMPAATVTKAQLKPGDELNITMTATSTITNAGSTSNVIEAHTITRGGIDVSGEYRVTYLPGTLTITPATLTITADSVTVLAGSAVPTFGYTASGFVDGESATVLSGSPSYTTGYSAAAVAGSTWNTFVSGLTAANYTINYVSGLITVLAPAVVPDPPDVPVDDPVDDPPADPVAVDLPDTETPLTNTPVEDEESETQTISEQDAPLGAGTPMWALANLILSILGALLALGLFIAYFVGRRKEGEQEGSDAPVATEDEQAQQYRKRMRWRIGVLVVAVLALILFLLTEDMTLPMGLVDYWTIAHAVAILAQIIFTILAVRRKKENLEGMSSRQPLRR